MLRREDLPDRKTLYQCELQPATEHPQGLAHRDCDSLFTADRPIIFNFNGYPWLVHRLTYRPNDHRNMHVRGYKGGNTNTPIEPAINNEIDRFTLAIEAIDGTPKLQKLGAHAEEKYRDQQIDCRNYAYEHGIDRPDIVSWRRTLTPSMKWSLPDLTGIFRAWTSPPNADLQVPTVCRRCALKDSSA